MKEPKKQPKKSKPSKDVTECNVTGGRCKYYLESCAEADCPLFCDYAIGEEW